MDMWNNPLPKRHSKRPKQRSQKVLPALRVASGKENLCPSDCREFNASLGESRSPLPEGFPRVPLQDITDILSPLNMPSAEGEELQGQVASGKCGMRRKKARQESLTVNKLEPRKQNARWEGLTQCSTAVVAKEDTQIQWKHQTAEFDEIAGEKAHTEVGKADSNTETGIMASSYVEDSCLHVKREQRKADSKIETGIMTSSHVEDSCLHFKGEHRKYRQSTRITQSKAKSSVLKLR